MKNLIVIVATGFSFGLNAQTADQMVIGALGGDFSNANIDVNYTAGEVVIQTETTANVIVTQGFHQPLDGIGGLYEMENTTAMTLFPNPTKDVLNVRIDEYGQLNGEAELVIYDINGQQVHNETLYYLNQNGTVQLNVGSLSSGHYQVRILTSDGIVSRAKFIKS